MASTSAATAFLSVRVAEATRDRLKAVAASRHETVQDLVGGLVERFLADEDKAPPTLAAVVTRLRARAGLLEDRGVAGLWVFGSVARGEAGRDSDVDLFADFRPDRRPSLVGLSSLRADLSDLLGATADVVERAMLHPRVREAAERDAVRVL